LNKDFLGQDGIRGFVLRVQILARSTTLNREPAASISAKLKQTSTCDGYYKEEPIVTSEARIPEPPDIFIYSKGTKYAIPINYVTHVRVDPFVKEIHGCAFQQCEF
jgi:hypothetical protein